MIDPTRFEQAYQRLRAELLAERTDAGHWVGELADSAVSTATAVSALSLVLRHAGDDCRFDRKKLRRLVDGGVAWLARHQNEDGGWGDTDRSLSNIATTMLALAALRLAGADEKHKDAVWRGDGYVSKLGGIEGLRRRYGKDKTFAVPILANCALAGMVPWSTVSPLPFEFACLPHSFFRLARLPVVSYAIPALVAVGQAVYFHNKPWNPIVRALRAAAIGRSLRKAADMQPKSGGYLEATPLTSFVTMSLAATGRADHVIVQRAVRFLIDSVRDDGGWPIDTNLATWVTSLSINALGAADETLLTDREGEDGVLSNATLEWLLSCQHRQRHPFTCADPGGWAWTDLTGGVPDADDTPAALLALHRLRDGIEHDEALRQRILQQAREGVEWLLLLQNGDGGWPTFCRGWGTLPFDRSSVDLTAHAIRALNAWESCMPGLASRINLAMERGFRFLEDSQRLEGDWVPLWFGNQFDPAEENSIYGTSRVLLAYADLDQSALPSAQAGLRYLVSRQNDDGGWGGEPIERENVDGPVQSSMEETAVALEALVAMRPEDEEPIERGAAYLIDRIEATTHREASPIGFYFAKLWYYEKLYPLIFATAALGIMVRKNWARR